MTSPVIHPTPNDVPFQEGLFSMPTQPGEKSQLIGSQCGHCGKIDFPRCPVCVDCMRDDDIQEIRLSRQGVVYVATIMRYQKIAPQGHQVPYAFGWVDLPEEIRVMTRLYSQPLERLRAGLAVELELIQVDTREDQRVLGFRFSAPPQ